MNLFFKVVFLAIACRKTVLYFPGQRELAAVEEHALQGLATTWPPESIKCIFITQNVFLVHFQSIRFLK